MNFFGHAAIASGFSQEPAFFLGAMLPDFSSMLGIRPTAVLHRELGDGVRFHHVTDEAFHDLDAFRELCATGMRALAARGVGRGTRRAVAHVGVELLLDAELAESPVARAAYFAGLRAGRDQTLLSALPWPADQRARLTRLASVLEERSDVAKPATEIVVGRLVRTLSERPRLAIAENALAAVADWVELARERVVASTPALVDELTTAIARRYAA